MELSRLYSYLLYCFCYFDKIHLQKVMTKNKKIKKVLDYLFGVDFDILSLKCKLLTISFN